MKKIKWMLIGTGGVLILWLLFNQFDAPEPKNVFSREDLRASYFGPDNGFYLLWGLVEPPEVDITSPETMGKYRAIFDPPGETDNFKRLKEFDAAKYKGGYKPFFKKLTNLQNLFVKKGEISWKQLESMNLKKMLPLDPDLNVLIERYRKLISAEDFQDFTEFHYLSPIPNLLTFLHVSRLYTAIHGVGALEGNWEENVSALFDQIDGTKKMIKGGRILVLNLVAKAVIIRTLNAVTYLMNRKECPGEVYELVTRRMPELQYEEFGSRDSFVGEFLAMGSVVSRGKAAIAFKFGEEFTFMEKLMVLLTYQRNRVSRMHYEYIKRCIDYESIPPHQWEGGFEAINMPRTRGAFWWFHNPGGKMLNDYWNANLSNVIHRSYRLKSIYDMVRIAAELHLHYSPDKPVQEILNSLTVYREIKDPCSGKPYRWNDEKQVLYGIGTDRKDDGGVKTKDLSSLNTDHPVPVILYVK